MTAVVGGTVLLGGCLLLLTFFGLHRAYLLSLYFRGRRGLGLFPFPGTFSLPRVTVQLPLYNERLVAERILRAAAEMEYPAHLLEIQVLDDSTDETVGIASRAALALRTEGGPRIVHLHRDDREGFKAGALAAGLAVATGELVAVFDSDFVPPRDFLRRAIEPFADPNVGMVQARWGFLNENDSILTKAQALSLRAHFHIEQGARFLAGRFFHFNGTAGIWRREAIASAGGWQGDTLTEDLDLSYRAQMRGWRFVYLDDLVAPSEIPPTVQAFRTQQFRWMKGTAEVARKLLPSLLASDLPASIKIEAALHFVSPLSYGAALLSFLIGLPLVWFSPDLPHVLITAYRISLAAVFAILAAYHYVAERGTGSWRGPADFAIRFLSLLVVGAGNALTGTRAYVEGLLGKRSPFLRTPKYADGKARGYRLRLDPWIGVEAVFACYALVFFLAAAVRNEAPLLVWAGIFLSGWTYAVVRQVAEAARGFEAARIR